MLIEFMHVKFTQPVMMSVDELFKLIRHPNEMYDHDTEAESGPCATVHESRLDAVLTWS